ncbi:MAG: hypothetical protein HQK76_12665 [Desulfobacterales bacterium]|nr:hypothetical protein [Desulfobacterales bacterium]
MYYVISQTTKKSLEQKADETLIYLSGTLEIRSNAGNEWSRTLGKTNSYQTKFEMSFYVWLYI